MGRLLLVTVWAKVSVGFVVISHKCVVGYGEVFVGLKLVESF